MSNLFLLSPVAHAGRDPLSYTLEERARIRGAMWPCIWPGRYGPRPGQPDNVLALDYYEMYTAPERREMLDRYTAGTIYTHGVTGPLIDPDGYHGHWPTYPGPLTQSWFDHYLDCLQEWYDHDPPILPIHFCHPDGWTLEEMALLQPFYRQPRAQRLLRIVVPPGWEPTQYEWSSYTWALFMQWGNRVFPEALQCLHTYTEVDAPAGVDARGNDNLNPNGNGDAWHRVAPYAHIWLLQNGPYSQFPADNPVLAQNFGDQFRPNVPHSIAWHFAGNAGWPTTSLWGNEPIRVCAAEQTAYTRFHGWIPEAAGREWGHLALTAGAAAGFLDSGY